MRKGDRLICLENINNLHDNPLFRKGDVYEVLYIDNEKIEPIICINHILHDNEYVEFKLDWVLKNFKSC